MDILEMAAFAFLAGLTACGLAATFLELRAKQQIRFAAPFVSTGHLQRSIAVTVAAGPFMLVNDALAAWRNQGISSAILGVCAFAAILWSTAAGIVVLALGSGIVALLG